MLVNKQIGLHTLCLLDIKVKEQSEENMARGRKIYEPPRFMTVNQALEQLLEVISERADVAAVLSPVLNLLSFLVQKYKYSLRSGTKVQILTRRCRRCPVACTQFTSFSGTKLKILTQKTVVGDVMCRARAGWTADSVHRVRYSASSKLSLLRRC